MKRDVSSEGKCKSHLRREIRGTWIESRIIRIEKRGTFIKLVEVSDTDDPSLSTLPEHVAIVVPLQKDLKFLGDLLLKSPLERELVHVEVRF